MKQNEAELKGRCCPLLKATRGSLVERSPLSLSDFKLARFGNLNLNPTARCRAAARPPQCPRSFMID